MPELPEVELARRHLECQVLRKVIGKVEVLDRGILEGIGPKDLGDCLVGRRFIAVKRHGKQLFLELEGGGCMTMHFGMTGEAIFSSGSRAPDKHDRLLIDFKGEGQLILNDQRKFGAISYCESQEEYVELKNLGPDAMSISKRDFVQRVGSHNKAIKTTLLDQHVVAGIGNLYSDEIVFQVKVHPMTMSSSLDPRRLGRMHQAMGEVLSASLEVRTDFLLLPKGYVLQDRTVNAPCPRGNGHLKTMVVGGRTAFFCPSCQPSP